MQGLQQDDGLPCTPFLLLLVCNGNWSLGLLCLHAPHQRSGSCSMVAEAILGFKTEVGQAEFECHVGSSSAATSAIVRKYILN